jgi:hypothetical protein
MRWKIGRSKPFVVGYPQEYLRFKGSIFLKVYVHYKLKLFKVGILLQILKLSVLFSVFQFNSIQFFNPILYYLCAEPTATRPITGTAQCWKK